MVLYTQYGRYARYTSSVLTPVHLDYCSTIFVINMNNFSEFKIVKSLLTSERSDDISCIRRDTPPRAHYPLSREPSAHLYTREAYKSLLFILNLWVLLISVSFCRSCPCCFLGVTLGRFCDCVSSVIIAWGIKGALINCICHWTVLIFQMETQWLSVSSAACPGYNGSLPYG